MAELFPGLVIGLVIAAIAVLDRLSGRGQQDLRAQIQRDIKLRDMLDIHSELDRKSLANLTVSIELGTDALIADTTNTTDWFDRWGGQWLHIIALILIFAGGITLSSLDDLEDLSNGWKLLIQIAGYSTLLVGVSLFTVWGARIGAQIGGLWGSRKSRSRKAQRSAPQPPAEDPEKRT